MSRFLREVSRRLHIASHEEHKTHMHDVSGNDHNHHLSHHNSHHHHHHHKHHNDNRSDTEEGETRASAKVSPKLLEEYHSVAKECWEALWEYLVMDESRWRLEVGESIKEGIIHSQKVKGRGKVFRLQAEVEMDAKSLWEEMVHNINKAPSWNPTLLECKTVAVIDENTDISLNVANQAAGGIVSSRDFVNLRHWGVRGGIYLSAGQGVTHPDCPPCKDHIRGYNGPGGWAFRPVPGEANKCVFIWIMDTDLKGWIPQRLLDQAAASVLQHYLQYLRAYVMTLRHHG